MNLPADISSCHALILAQQQQILALTARLEALEARLNATSKNSNKPPSTDGYRKKPAIPRLKGKKRGGQIGHKGKTLDFSSHPDKQVTLLPEVCSCGAKLSPSSSTLQESRQVFELPKAQLEVTQYDLHACHCSNCGQYQQGKFPSGVNARVQYGSGVRALSVLLHTNFQLPLKKIKILFGDLFGYELNQSSTLSAIKKCYEQLQKSEALIKKQLTEGSLTHFDESGLRVEGKLHWLHVASNEVLTYLFVHQKRGKLALEDQASVLPNFKGWAIHDCWASYFKFDQCKHAICGAHLIRELIALEENGSEWAACFRTFLFSLYELTDQGRDCLNSIQKQYALHTFHDIWKYANDLEPMPEKKGKGRPKATKGRNLLNRLKIHLQAVLAFAFHQQVPFTNNQAERDIRPIKTKLKVAGCFRTFSGAQRYARIQGFISSARKNNKHVLNEIIKALNGKDTFIHDLIPC